MNTDKFLCVLFGPALVLVACSTTRTTDRGEVYPWNGGRGSGVLHLHATYTAPYCGGADPGPEGMPRPMPWRGAMYLRAAAPDSSGVMAPNELQRPIVDTIRTDATGHGTLSLPAGYYLLLDQDRVDERRYQQLLKEHGRSTLHTDAIDKACLDRWLHGPFGVVTIRGGDTTHVELPLFDQCPWYSTPCVSYHGPLPP
ncbi:MAG TPA: hypothetical protein PKE21_01610 [Flavobacteriales bacterium]|nr:hypothetical protein [Flavobacteriales bacterium]HMR26150.1 hypothetical protein [Flavobacteriales bacterium]